MNFCKKHWDAIKEDVERLGLSRFVAQSGEQAVEHIVREFEGESTVVDFEPLLGASGQLFSIACNFIGSSVMFAAEGDERPPCPVCAIETYDWCEGAVAQAVKEAARRGLMTSEEIDQACKNCEWRSASEAIKKREELK